MDQIDKIRIDKWLWAVRVYKTRSLAIEACDGGKVKIEGDNVKPSKMLSGGETIKVNKDGIDHLFVVKQLLSKRVGAQLVNDYLEDKTPVEEMEARKLLMKTAFYRKKGLGRPTKKERRSIDKLRGN